MMSDRHAVMALGYLEADLSRRVGGINGSRPPGWPEPPEWMEMWQKATEATAMRAASDDEQEAEIIGGMLQWVPGSLSDVVVQRIGTDALADVWNNGGRKAADFQQTLQAMIYAATGIRMSVYCGPRAASGNDDG